MRFASSLGVVLAVGVVYGATLSQNLGAAHDSVAYLNAIDAGEGLFHPHHLLFAPVARIWLDALFALGLEIDSARGVALLSAVAGALLIGLLFDLLRTRLELAAAPALGVSALAAFSFGPWFYSVSVETYLLPLPFLVAALHRLSGPGEPRGFLLTGALHGIAVLFHQMHGLFLVPVIVAAIQRHGLVAGARAVGLHLLPFLALAGGGYLLVLVVALDVYHPLEMLRFGTRYLEDGSFWFEPSLATPLLALLGAGRALVGGHFVFALPGARARLDSLLGGHELRDEAWLVRELSPLAAEVLLALTLVFGLALLLLLVRALARLAASPPASRRIAVLATSWLLAYAAFFSFWVPHNPEFWIPQVLSLWLLLACGSGLVTAAPGSAHARSRRRGAELAALAALLATLNFFGSVRWLARPEHDHHLALVAPFARHAEAGDLVIVGRAWILQAYARRYTDARVLALAEVFHDRPGRAAAETREQMLETLRGGGRVFVAHDAVDLTPNVRREVGAEGEAAIGRLFAEPRWAWRRGAGPAGPFYEVVQSNSES